MVYDNIIRILFLSSNLVFLIPALYVLKKKVYKQKDQSHTALLSLHFCSTCVFSFLYHLCDPGDQLQDHGIYNICFVPWIVLFYLDFTFSIILIPITILYDLRTSMSMLFYLVTFISMFCISATNIYKSDLDFYKMYLLIACVLSTSFAYRIYRQFTFPKTISSFRNVFVCVICWILALLCFVLDSFNYEYAYLHSLWHIFSSLGCLSWMMWIDANLESVDIAI